MSDILAKIAAYKRDDVAARKAAPSDDIEARAARRLAAARLPRRAGARTRTPAASP